MSTIDDFIEWFCEWLSDLGGAIKDILVRAWDLIMDFLAGACFLVIVIVTFPLWFIPFLFWWFSVRKKDGEEG